VVRVGREAPLGCSSGLQRGTLTLAPAWTAAIDSPTAVQHTSGSARRSASCTAGGNRGGHHVPAATAVCCLATLAAATCEQKVARIKDVATEKALLRAGAA
jgi:hypothetical protein